MQDPAYAPPPPPLSFLGRSPVDGIRLRWSGIGNIALAMPCFFGIRNAGGIILGLMLIALAIATWAVTQLGRKDWYYLRPGEKVIAGIGATTGLGFLYLFFAAFWLVIGMLKLFTFFSK